MVVDVLKIKSIMLYKGITNIMLAKELGLSESTLRNRFRNPGEFNQEEMAIMIKMLEIEKPQEVFFT